MQSEPLPSPAAAQARLEQLKPAKYQAMMDGDNVRLKQILEESVIAELSLSNEPAFLSDYKQLEKLYFSVGFRRELRFDERECLLIGIGLMMYLKQNDLPAFHVLVQQVQYVLSQRADPIAPDARRYIDFPLALEKEIMNGNTSGLVSLAQKQVPHPALNVFASALVRDVASALDAAPPKPAPHTLKTWLTLVEDLEAV